MARCSGPRHPPVTTNQSFEIPSANQQQCWRWVSKAPTITRANLQGQSLRTRCNACSRLSDTAEVHQHRLIPVYRSRMLSSGLACSA